VDARHKAGHDDGRGAGTAENPVKRRDMIPCWQNGRYMLLPASEVARLMKGGNPSSSPGSAACASRREGDERHSRAPQEPGASVAPYAAASRSPAPREREEGSDYGLAAPPYIPRNRSLARNEIWQLLAKRLADHTKHWRSCHAPRCRRAHQCMGGSNACFLREFEAVDEFFQRHLMPHIRREAARAGQ
jgi:hypothetical protein